MQLRYYQRLKDLANCNWPLKALQTCLVICLSAQPQHSALPRPPHSCLGSHRQSVSTRHPVLTTHTALSHPVMYIHVLQPQGDSSRSSKCQAWAGG